MTMMQSPCGAAIDSIKDNDVTATTFGDQPSPREQILAVIENVARRHKVTVADIIGKRRDRVYVAARHEAIARVATTWPWISYPHLGRIFGGRDHTTIMHALKKHGVPGRSGIIGAPCLTQRVTGLVMGRLFKALADAVEAGR